MKLINYINSLIIMRCVCFSIVCIFDTILKQFSETISDVLHVQNIE